LYEFDISPDDQSIAFAYMDGTNYSIYAADINGANVKLLAHSETYQYHDPCFSADGRKIMFTSFQKEDGGIASYIHILDLGDNSIRHLKFDIGYITETAFSPDGESIFFICSRVYKQYSPMYRPGLHEDDIYSASADGTNLRKLTDLNSYGLSDLCLSSDGKTVYFLDNSLAPKFCSFPLADPKKMTTLIKGITTAQLSPDGRYVAFTKSVSGNGVYAYDLHLFNVQNKQVARLTSLRKNVEHVCFLKKGGRLLFMVDQNWPGRSRAHQLFQVNMDGSGLKEIDLVIPSALTEDGARDGNTR
jgi:TolB protein